MMDSLRILVVGGHPADVFDHCGGTMAHHVEKGDRVTCLALTQGLRIHDVVISEKFREGVSQEDTANLEKICAEREAVKYREVQDACACFGVTDVRFLRYDDRVLLETSEMVEAAARVIRDVRPHILITHFPFEGGGVGNHHATAARIAQSAAALAATFDFDGQVAGWRIAQTFFMIPSANRMNDSYLSAMFQPYCSYYVDITDVVDKKVAALNCMKSQQYEGRYAMKRTEVCEGAFGHHMRVGYAEAFIPCSPEIGFLLPLSEERYLWANEPEAETRQRGSVMKAPFFDQATPPDRR